MPEGPLSDAILSSERSDADRASISVLVVDDERTIRESCASLLRAEGFSVTSVGSAGRAREAIERMKADILIVDLYMKDTPGMQLLEEALRANPASLVIMITGRPSVRSSIEALRAGAWHYLPKPFSATQFSIVIGRAAHTVMVARECQRLRGTDHPDDDEIPLLGDSEVFQRVVSAARQVAQTDASVFLHGETGTGKELIARFIHSRSPRRSRELVMVNSAAVPESLVESEMFGHVRGAFTGAVSDKRGLLEEANGGTLFLDEISDMPPPLQAKLLRVLQDGVVRRVGSTKVDAIVNLRFIAATNSEPTEAVRRGHMRRDLYYRLSVVPIRIPPLRERREDIPVLAHHFIHEFWRQHRGADLPQPILTEEALAALKRLRWPGNVRELRNLMERAVVTLPPGARVLPTDIPGLDEGRRTAGPGSGVALDQDYHTAREQVLADFERQYVERIMSRTGGKISDAARLADVDPTTLYRLLDKHGLRKADLVPTPRPLRRKRWV